MKEMIEQPNNVAIEEAEVFQAPKAEFIEKIKDPEYLPTRQDLYDAFADNENKLKDWTYFCDRNDVDHPIYEFINEGFVKALSDYILERTKSFTKKGVDKVTILELGAGDGRLTHFLKERLNEESIGMIDVVATDTGSWKIKQEFPVENITNEEALKKYKPQIVISSWMPPRVDFTAAIRACPSVDEYLLIGEAYGATGEPWLTWGQHGMEQEDIDEPPVFEKENFYPKEIESISKEQLCKLDEPSLDSSEGFSVSSTISFKRKK